MSRSALNASARNVITRFASKLPLAVLTRSIPRNVIVLMYHAVGDAPAPHLRHLYEYKTPAQFEADLIFVKQHFHLPTWSEFAAGLDKSGRPDRPSLLITFDDGLSECYRFVRPLLLKHQVPCLFFVVKNFIDNRAMFFRHKASLCIEKFEALEGLENQRVLNVLAVEAKRAQFVASQFAGWMHQLGHVDEPTIDRVCRILAIDVNGHVGRATPLYVGGGDPSSSTPMASLSEATQ